MVIELDVDGESGVGTWLEKLMTELSSSRLKGVYRLEDQCFQVKAVIGALGLHKLPLDPAAPALLDLPERIKRAHDSLGWLSKTAENEARGGCSSLLLWRPRLEQSARDRLKSLSSALENLISSAAWRSLEKQALDGMTTVVYGPSNRRRNSPAERHAFKDKIVQFLLRPCPESVKHVPVVSLFGAKGLGKSKLAKAIFDDKLIVEEFGSLRFWVNTGGDEFDLTNVVQNIIECVAGSRTEDLPLPELKNFLGKLIPKKKFFLVLDDFLSKEVKKWGELMECLVGGEVGSRVVVVTRRPAVAMRISTWKRYEVKGLGMNDSLALWDLDVPEGDKRFEKVQKEIVRNCGKIPLYVELIGKVVRYRPLEAELLPFVEKVRDQLNVGGSSALRLSYDYLPPQLQKCFVYCRLFPRGQDIEVERLIHHWMAQQYIIRPEGVEESLEEIGMEYFRCLMRRSFLTEGERDALGNITTCRLQNAMRDFASELAGSLGHKVLKKPEEYEKTEEEEKQEEKEEEEKHDDKYRTRHVSFHFHFNSKLSRKCSLDARHLRTFMLPYQNIMKNNEGQFRNSFAQDMLTKFRHLYVCDLHSSGITKVPSCIQNLGCLRYLDISDNDEIKYLPDTITGLRHLQVLNVAGCEMLEELPRNIRRLTNLRHLYCHRCWNLKYMPSGIGALTELRTLSWFVVAEDSSLFAHIGGLGVLEGLENLREVEIRNLKHLRGGDPECKRAKMTEKKHLQSLTLCWNHDEDDDNDKVADAEGFDLDLPLSKDLKRLKLRDYKGVTFPLKFESLVNLVHVWLKNCARCETIPPLEHIETLKSLSVQNFPRLLYIQCGEKHGANTPLFKSLEQLSLSNCPNLKGWAKSENENDPTLLGIEYFKNVSSAVVENCPNFKPDFLQGKDEPTAENSRTGSGPPALIQFHRKRPRKQTIKRVEAILRDMIRNDPENAKTPIKWGTSVVVEDVESFPEELLKNMSCFKKLHINNCSKLLSLPEALKHCATLQELEISGCPLLEARLGNENGADWPLVAHIPYLRINSEYVKWEGQLQSNPKAPVPAPPVVRRRNNKACQLWRDGITATHGS